MDQIELFNNLLRIIISYLKPYKLCKLFVLDKETWWIELLILNRNTWNHLTVWEQIMNIKYNYLC